MNLLNWNQRKVQNLRPLELWLFIVGRVLVAFGLGILAMCYFPRMAYPFAVPLVIVGLVFLLIGFKGFKREDSPSSQ
jgi:hypothetical protein